MADAAQRRFWSGRGAARFSGADLGTLTTRLLELAEARPGEHVVDVGCGAGGTSRLLKERVGATGSVLGIDISAPLLAVARGRAPGVELVHADAASYPFPPSHFQLVFSQFGMTFFADPAAAFAGFFRALAPGGRLLFVCYGPTDATGWLTLVVSAARAAVPSWRPPRLAGTPGPFAFADRDQLAALIANAGFDQVRVDPHHGKEPLGATLAEATATVLARPLVQHLLATLGPAGTRARAQVKRELAAFATSDGYATPTTLWLVSATRPRGKRARARAS